MSGTHTDVPVLLTADLPVPVPRAEYEACPVTEIARRLGDKWTVLILALLGRGPHRFNALERSIEGISQRMLTRTLRQLQADGLVVRTVYPTVPPSVEYSLSAAGRDLLGPVSALAGWAVAWSRANNDPQRRDPATGENAR
ncbi:helix-turn-helix domain-containing protein [Nocardia sp. NPDC024068]|uniref:winged helix-turn-helix transcriptional regulator n=1 Tax=Nocardia sp. NPDC024068 TaxID=3157197 RepID=UPI0034008B61